VVTDLPTQKASEQKALPDGASGLWLVQVYPPAPDGMPAAAREVTDFVHVGREPGLDHRLHVPDQAMSRTHFRMVRSGAVTILEDLGSTNGTFLNRERTSSCAVTVNDVIRAGDSLFVVTEQKPTPRDDLRHRGVVVCNAEMFQVFERADKAAVRKTAILIVGETGTGKDLLAQHIHTWSGRPGRFVPVNCAAIQEGIAEASLFGAKKGAFTGAENSEGWVQHAHRGTLFLDEIGDLSEPVQAKLLRFLDNLEVVPVGSHDAVKVDVRILAATNRAGATGTLGGTLRPDVRARLEDEVLYLLPLRARRDEIVALAWAAVLLGRRFPLEMLNTDFVHELLLYSWPRNVRQLFKAVGRCVAHSKGPKAPLSLSLLAEALAEPVSPGPTCPSEDASAPRLISGQAIDPSTPLGAGHRPLDSARGRPSTPRLCSGQAIEPDPGATCVEPPPGSAVEIGPPPDELLAMLVETDYNVSAVARRLGRHRMQVYRWIRRAGIKLPEGRQN